MLNTDDEYGQKLAKIQQETQRGSPDLWADQGRLSRRESWKLRRAERRFDLITPDGMIPLSSPLIGRVNVYNILAAAAAAYARGCAPEAIAKALRALARVPGRFERVDCRQPFTVVVDYAHTDDALRNLTALAREFVNERAEGPSDYGIRLRRRSRSRQASVDGRSRGTRQRLRGADLRQSAQRRSAGDHQ